MANIGEREKLKNDAGDAAALADPVPETEDTSETDTPEAPEPPAFDQPKRGRGRPPGRCPPLR